MKATYAGHSAVLFEHEGSVCAVDPWLEGNPLCPEGMVTPERLDVIVVTHGHGDHASDVVRLHEATGAVVVAVFELGDILREEGIPSDKVIDMGKGGTQQVGEWSVTLTHAVHSNSYDSPSRGRLYAGEACGVVLSNGGVSIYHAGDTALFEEMAWIGSRYRPAAAFLPIGDRYTMGPEDAAEAARRIGAPVTIPIHYRTFPVLTHSARGFLSACASHGVIAQELAPGESLEIGQ